MRTTWAVWVIMSWSRLLGADYSYSRIRKSVTIACWYKSYDTILMIFESQGWHSGGFEFTIRKQEWEERSGIFL